MNNALHYVLDRFQVIKAIAKLVGPDAVVGILRQGFILLMTAFDAVIFDLVRVKLRKDFFKLISALGKNEKITFQDIAEAGNMDVLQNEIIEEQVKKRYVKDLLVILSNDMGSSVCWAGSQVRAANRNDPSPEHPCSQPGHRGQAVSGREEEPRQTEVG
ncbi:MAG: hypothetical protein L0241_02605 [Planctomycetia bacterium]|nr:hypothetical protein [Planctomycetia bacterium]